MRRAARVFWMLRALSAWETAIFRSSRQDLNICRQGARASDIARDQLMWICWRLEVLRSQRETLQDPRCAPHSLLTYPCVHFSARFTWIPCNALSPKTCSSDFWVSTDSSRFCTVLEGENIGRPTTLKSVDPDERTGEKVTRNRFCSRTTSLRLSEFRSLLIKCSRLI